MLPATGSVPLRGNCRSRDTAFSLCMDNSLPTRVAHRLPRSTASYCGARSPRTAHNAATRSKLSGTRATSSHGPATRARPARARRQDRSGTGRAVACSAFASTQRGPGRPPLCEAGGALLLCMDRSSHASAAAFPPMRERLASRWRAAGTCVSSISTVSTSRRRQLLLNGICRRDVAGPRTGWGPAGLW